MMHHHTKFDRLEILSGQTFTEVQNLHCDLDLEYSKATFSQDTPAYEHALSNCWSPKNNIKKIKKISSSEHIIEIVIFDCMNQNSVTVTFILKTETIFSHMTLWLIMMFHHTGFGYKWFSDA